MGHFHLKIASRKLKSRSTLYHCRRPSSQPGRSGSGGSRAGGSRKPSGSSSGRRGSGTSTHNGPPHPHSSRKKAPVKDKEPKPNLPKKALQTVYTPPFSLKMVYVELGTDDPKPPSTPATTTPIYERELPPIPEQVD